MKCGETWFILGTFPKKTHKEGQDNEIIKNSLALKNKSCTAFGDFISTTATSTITPAQGC